MYARTNTLTADPSRVDEGIALVRDVVAAALAEIDGCTGVSLLVNRESGRFITTSAWRDETSMLASDARINPLREKAASLLRDTPVVRAWEIAVLHRVADAGSAPCVRVTWTRTDVDHVQRSVDNYRSTLLPAMEELPGFRSASLFVDRSSGRAASSVTYGSRAGMDEAREMASSLRRSAVEENDVEILEVAEFDLVLAGLKVPELA